MSLQNDIDDIVGLFIEEKRYSIRWKNAGEITYNFILFLREKKIEGIDSGDFSICFSIEGDMFGIRSKSTFFDMQIQNFVDENPEYFL